MIIKPWQQVSANSENLSDPLQVYSAYFDIEGSSLFFNLLSSKEKERSQKLQNPTIADRQIISRGILRIVLGAYLKRDPKELVIEPGMYGKPELVFPQKSGIHFNLSHSGSLLLIAIGNHHPIGIDIEEMDNTIDVAAVSNLTFSQMEKKALQKSHSAIIDFYKIWTAKEAILKASGKGFSYPSAKFSVVNDVGMPSLTNIPTELSGSRKFTLTTFSPAVDYFGAIAVLQ